MQRIMKKNVLVTACLAAVMLLASCVKNEDYTVTSERDFAYVTTVNDIKCAATSNGYITGPEVKTLDQNECYFVSYELGGADQNQIYNTTLFSNLSMTPIPQTAIKVMTPPATTPVATTELNVVLFSATDYVDDRWLFTYTTAEETVLNTVVNFYYDANNQIDEEGNDVTHENKIIIDVQLVEGQEDAEEATDKALYAVGSLEQLRAIYPADFSASTSYSDGKKRANVLVQFRFKKHNVSTNVDETTYLGTWDIDSISGEKVYYMTFVKN